MYDSREGVFGLTALTESEPEEERRSWLTFELTAADTNVATEPRSELSTLPSRSEFLLFSDATFLVALFSDLAPPLSSDASAALARSAASRVSLSFFLAVM